MNNEAIKKLKGAGQSIWLDSLSRKLITSGELASLVSLGVSGVTSNPVIFKQAINNGTAYDQAVIEHANAGLSSKEIYERIAVEDIRATADIFINEYESSNRTDGFVSIEVDPSLARNTEGTFQEARRLWRNVSRPNVMIKVPGTVEGIPAIKALTAEGINVNVTLLFSTQAYAAASDAYLTGLSDYLDRNRKQENAPASVASFFVSRLDTAIDALLPENDPRRGKAGIANALLAYEQFTLHGNASHNHLKSTTSRRVRTNNVQKPLWASTSVKNPAYSPNMYVSVLARPCTVNTLPPASLQAVMQGVNIIPPEKDENERARKLFISLQEDGIDLKTVTDRLLLEGIETFAKAFNELIETVKIKTQATLQAG